MFDPDSRYYGLPTGELTTPDGRAVRYVLRRFLPPPERFALLREHTVVEGDRLDNVAAEYLGDPTQFWRLADANGAMQPDDLTRDIGRRLRIALPEGIPGPADG